YDTKNINVNINNTVINNSIGNKINNNSDIINDNENLIKKLKEYRLQMSRAENTKPYFIFNDKQMTGLLEKMPKTKSELKEVSGFGEVKVEKYGDFILKILND
ncbi:HRDC domain-containing protein, partial [Clostridium tertium]|uniref:HRDC domain-containing protein n=1 Tax=Clostridium tertium TaxID=1559 RepID=UPI00374E9CC6